MIPTWCDARNIEIISQLQESDYGIDRKSEVWLIRDIDNIFKILKEIVEPPPDYISEDKIYPSLPPLTFIPKMYSTHEISGRKFMKRSFIYGQPLSDYCFEDNLLNKNDAIVILKDIAERLQMFLYCHLYFLDLQPENVLISTSDVFFPDLGLSKFFTKLGFRSIINSESVSVQALINHPRYCAPETLHVHEANEKSIVFQLGIVAQEILTGKYPIKKIALDNIEFNQPIENSLIAQMLSARCYDRPTLMQCFEGFKKQCTSTSHFIKRKGIPHFAYLEDTVLFPARMGIPHRGHINYISSLLDLHYKVIISIQRSYTITDRDPIQKYLVMKMVAQSLLDAGYSPESFKFYLTPFFKTQKEMSLYFTMMPRFDKIVAVASSNPSVLELDCLPSNHITQQHVFGAEGENYETLSWGEIIRTAIKNNDYKTFKEYVASGVESILTFDELREIYNITPIEFVHGKVSAYVNDLIHNTNFTVPIINYSSPEECIIRHYSKSKILDPYSKDTLISVYDKKVQLSYKKYDFNFSNETLYFQIKPMEV